MAGQQQVSRDQQSVQSAETALAQILSSQSSASSKTGSPSGAGTSGGSGGDQSEPVERRQSSSGNAELEQGQGLRLVRRLQQQLRPRTATNSAAQLASDQARIDSDQAILVSAQQSLDNGTLKAPMAGTVAAVDSQSDNRSVPAPPATPSPSPIPAATRRPRR